MPSRSYRSRPGTKVGLILLALAASACDLLTGSSSDDDTSFNIDPNGYSIHINPGDPVIVSAPDGEGNIVQLLGDKSANGRALRIRSIRRFSTDAPGEYDHVAFDDNGFPAEAKTRAGGQVFFAYPGNGRVVMTVTAPDGSIQSVPFEWYDYGSPAAATRSRSPTFQSSATATANLTVSVREDVPERTPVEDAYVEGYWLAASDRYAHLPFVARHAGGGVYQAAVPVGPANLKKTEISDACEIIPDVVNEFCEGLKRGGANREFWRLSLAACSQLRIPALIATCTAAVTVIPIACTILPACDKATSQVDKYLKVNERVVVRGTVRSGDFSAPFSSEIRPPFPATAQVEVLVPARGWGGRWVGTWRGTSAGADPGPGPLIITMRQTGSNVSGSYDLTYGVANLTGSVASGTLVVMYSGANAQARVTLTRNGNSLSGSHVDTYPNRVLTFALSLARSRSSTSHNPTILPISEPKGANRPVVPSP